jgi:hypothetical protein
MKNCERAKKFFRIEVLSAELEEDGFPLVCGGRRGYVARMGLNGQRPAEGLGKVSGEAETGPQMGHPERFCPNCSAELKESRCKLSCPGCGFYLSCSDFY